MAARRALPLPRSPSGFGPLRWLGPLLVPLSWPYRAVVRRRTRRMRARATRLDVPVVSVGNLTCGGTGKTPTVEMVARDLAASGRKPAIVSRGYGSGPAAENDEFRVLAANLPGVDHVQDADRVAAGRRAVERGADVIILDDGFQHVRLGRDLDIVLLDALRPFDNGRLLPAGLLREPVEALERADLIAVTRCELAAPEALEELRTWLKSALPTTPTIELGTRVVGWHDALEETRDEAAPMGAVVAFCGIGHPEAFRRQLVKEGSDVRAFLPFPDHHAYTRADLERVARQARAIDATAIVMTQKDAVKLTDAECRGAMAGERWLSMVIRQEILAGDTEYRRALRSLTARDE